MTGARHARAPLPCFPYLLLWQTSVLGRRGSRSSHPPSGLVLGQPQGGEGERDPYRSCPGSSAQAPSSCLCPSTGLGLTWPLPLAQQALPTPRPGYVVDKEPHPNDRSRFARGLLSLWQWQPSAPAALCPYCAMPVTTFLLPAGLRWCRQAEQPRLPPQSPPCPGGLSGAGAGAPGCQPHRAHQFLLPQC